MKNSKGFMDADYTGAFMILILVSAFVGWAVIELLLWLLAFAWDLLVAYAASKEAQCE